MTDPSKRYWITEQGIRDAAQKWLRNMPIYGWIYRALIRFAHRHDWHHAKVFGPFEDGRYQRWCQWCGLRESYSHDPRKPIEGPIKLMRWGGRND